MSLSDLREFWSARWGFAPRLRSVALLRHMIGWRLQSALLGGLDVGTRDLLRRKSIPRAPRPCPGTRLTREFRGVLHEVEVRDETFSYAGREHGSLSQVARAGTACVQITMCTATEWISTRPMSLRTSSGVPPGDAERRLWGGHAGSAVATKQAWL